MTVIRTLASVPIAQRSTSPIVTSEEVIPGSAPDGSYMIFSIDLSQADRENPAITLSAMLERSVAPDWRHVCGVNWVGGVYPNDPESGLPYIPQCDVAIVTGVAGGGGRVNRNKRGWRLRGTILVPDTVLPISLGWRMEIVTFD